VLSTHMLASKPAPHVPKGIVSDWTQRHVLYPDSRDDSAMARFRKDPRWEQNWYLRHREAWWPEHRREPRLPDEESKRDWSISLGTAAFQPANSHHCSADCVAFTRVFPVFVA